MGFGVDGIVTASMSMSEAQASSAYNIAMVKKSMEAMEEQAMAMVDMMQAAPSPYNFDVYG